MTTDVHNVPLQIVRRGEVPRAASAYAAEKIEHLLRRTQDPVHSVRLVLDLSIARTHQHPARIEIGAFVARTPIRVSVTASTLHEATDLAIDVLRRRLRQLRDRPLSRRHRAPATRDDADHQRTTGRWLPDPELAARPVVRHKSFTLTPMTAEEAAAEMNLLDHDFYLYAKHDTGRPAVLYRRTSGGYSVVGGNGTPVPALTTAQAKERLALTGDQFLLFQDTEAEQARVLYRRYDGTLGLLLAS